MITQDDWTIIVIAACVVLVLLPPRYDPSDPPASKSVARSTARSRPSASASPTIAVPPKG